jgi:hypothetical protein
MSLFAKLNANGARCVFFFEQDRKKSMLPLRQPLSTKAQEWAQIFALSRENRKDGTNAASHNETFEQKTDDEDSDDDLIFAIEDVG